MLRVDISVLLSRLPEAEEYGDSKIEPPLALRHTFMT